MYLSKYLQQLNFQIWNFTHACCPAASPYTYEPTTQYNRFPTINVQT